MSKNKRGTRGTELDELKSENKELRSVNKSLLREIKKLNKELRVEFNQDDLIKEDIEDRQPKRDLCTHCARGHLEHIDLGPRILIKCTVCDEYRRIIKKPNA